ncbi:hypothetical protein SAMN04487770_105128 [Butyrivibrio sp. ob235]|uniref:hypothetical protein n=1 Tax=Butyrivibrio sp. ob235 TaxID=1761780 RepID=UPI0008C8B233|nr:hypothetical protein [Butyrivibrio sp. ob235]SEL06094.1 hypothetical protein SAMN04487770_105128 [Butyrivibrio sp. ob235]
MAIKKNKKLRRIIFIAITVLVIVILATVLILLFRPGKSDSTGMTSYDDLKETITEESAGDNIEATEEETVEQAVVDPGEVLASAAYKEGIISRATQFRDECASLYTDISGDLARFSLIDIDKDGIPELIMHDVSGKRAFYCSYVGEAVSEPFEIYVDETDDDSSYMPGTYAALFLEKNLFIKYVILNNGGRIESYLYRVNEQTKAPELINNVAVENGASFMAGDGSSVSEEDYRAVFSSALGDDYGHYFLDELMIADGEYDFKSQYSWGSSPALSHMTLDELSAKIGG